MMEKHRYYIPNEDHLMENSNILLIDGEQKSRLVVDTILRNTGFNLTVAKSGADGLKMMLKSNEPYGFVVINIKEGMRTSQLLRNCGFKKPVIYYTEANIKEPLSLMRFPDTTSIYPISTSNNTWAVR